MDVTRILAEFATGTRRTGLPDAVCHETVRAFVNWMGCALGGAKHITVDTALAAYGEFSGGPHATVVGRSERVDAPTAALLNCIASSAHAFDDTHLASVIHPAGPIAAPVLSLAERRKLQGADVLAALAIGLEVECRIGVMTVVPPAGGHIGWYATGIAGGIGAAAACAHLLGLDERTTVSALGAAAMQASGLRAGHGTMSTAFVPGHAARCGLMSALMAEKGFVCAPHVLEGPNGFGAVFGHDSPNLEAAAGALGTRWELQSNAYKPYPCGIVIHPVIDACLLLASSGRAAADAIARIELTVNPLCLTLCDRPEPAGNLDGQVSVQHWTAATLIDKAAGLAQVTETRVRDADVIALRRKVEARPDPAYARDEARVVIELIDGVRLEEHVLHCIGSLDRPMSDNELTAKFLAQAELVLTHANAKALLDRCWNFQGLRDVADIARAAVP
jgi:2-methylcitrate dehydratase PrpD